MAAMESKTNLGCRRSLVASWAIGATMLVVAGAGFAPKSVHAQASAEAGAGSRASTPTERILMERVQAQLVPNELVFFAPWDGTYDT